MANTNIIMCNSDHGYGIKKVIWIRVSRSIDIAFKVHKYSADNNQMAPRGMSSVCSFPIQRPWGHATSGQ